MSDSDAEIPRNVEIDPAFYRRMRKANENLEKALRNGERQQNEQSYIDNIFSDISDRAKSLYNHLLGR